MWSRVFIGLILLAVAALFLSRRLLEGPDPEGWWNYVPAITFYVSTALIVAFALVLALLQVLRAPFARVRSRRS